MKCLSPFGLVLVCGAGAEQRILVKQFATLDCTGDHSEDYVEDGGCHGTDILQSACSHIAAGNISDTSLECSESEDQPGVFSVIIVRHYSWDFSCGGDVCAYGLKTAATACDKGSGGDKSWQFSCHSSDEPVPDPTPEPEPDPTPEPGPDPTPEPGPDPTPDPTPEPGPDPTPVPLAGIQIQSNVSSLCIDLPGGDTSNGALLWTLDCVGNENQKWAFQDGQLVYSPDPSKCVDLLGGDSTNGNQLGLWDCYQGDSQMWGFDEEWGTIYLASSTASDATKCAQIGGGNNGDPLVIWDCTSEPQQIWRIGSPASSVAVV